VAVIFLTLSIIAGTTGDEGVLKACYTTMHLFAKTSVRASTIGTLVTGILLSVLNKTLYLQNCRQVEENPNETQI